MHLERSNDAAFNDAAQWKRNLVKLVDHVRPYAKEVQAAYRKATLSVASENRCGLLDLYSAYAAAGAAAANTAGLMLDGVHPSQLGHNDIAARVWRLLRTFS